MPTSRLKRLSNSTPTPMVKLSLGSYVVAKARAGGTARVYFQVPPRLRPEGWLPAIPLPRNGRRTGNLSNAAEVAAIQRDAADLYAELTGDRHAARAADARSLTALVSSWRQSSLWPANAKTAGGYNHYIKRVLAWEEVLGGIDPTHLTRAEIETFLAYYNDRPQTKKHLHVVLRLIMDQAIAKGWRADNPCSKIKIRVPVTHALIWEQTDVDEHVSVARTIGRDSIALIVLMEWEIGQRLTDVRAFRSGSEYDAEAGIFRFYQSKTRSYVTIPVSTTLRELLGAALDGEGLLFKDEVTGLAYSEERLSKVFAQVRAAVHAKALEHAPQAVPRHLLLKWLRHSCVVQLARNGCTPLEIAAITGHAIASVVTILSVYLPRDNEVAWNAQAKRGLVAARVA
jgi:hypothetical protein